MSAVWTVVLLVGIATVGLKAVGPVVLGERKIPAVLSAVLFLLAPALLAALVVTQAVGGERELVLDARLLGLAAAVIAIVLRVPLIGVVVIAATVAALARALS
ncbi:MAG TPA: AzlD domain-containing protein [Gaiellaceae bacterium]|nr:AzlD domain-containing protein [Gaiellaceae bacterium]